MTSFNRNSSLSFLFRCSLGFVRKTQQSYGSENFAIIDRGMSDFHNWSCSGFIDVYEYFIKNFVI